MMILFLLVGLSSFSLAQGRHNGKRNGLETNKKVEPRKQMFHFEKREKDKKIASKWNHLPQASKVYKSRWRWF